MLAVAEVSSKVLRHGNIHQRHRLGTRRRHLVRNQQPTDRTSSRAIRVRKPVGVVDAANHLVDTTSNSSAGRAAPTKLEHTLAVQGLARDAVSRNAAVAQRKQHVQHRHLVVAHTLAPNILCPVVFEARQLAVERACHRT